MVFQLRGWLKTQEQYRASGKPSPPQLSRIVHRGASPRNVPEGKEQAVIIGKLTRSKRLEDSMGILSRPFPLLSRYRRRRKQER